MSADQFKAEGNAAFAAKDFQKAIDLFTKAIDVSESPNHVLFSNRSACHASLRDFDDALKDAEECVKINPSWAKGYTRKAAALHGLGDLIGASDAYEQALKLDPNNAQAQSGLKSVQDAISSEAQRDGGDLGLGAIFSDPGAWKRLQEDPKTKDYMKDPEFVKLIQSMSGKNPMEALGLMQSDPRVMQALSVMMGIAVPGADGEGSQPADVKSEEKKPEPKKEAKPEPVEPEVPDSKKEADAEKALGNAAYKKRSFEEAIGHYNKAYELHKDVTYLNNRSAAEFEAADYDTAIKTAERVIEEGREVRADYTAIAKAYGRIGSCYAKKGDLKAAIENFNKSLTEHRTPDILNKLRTAEKELKQREADAYLDPAKAEEAREEGNKKFKEGDWPGAVKEYTEAVKRAPNDPKGYANRAAALLKLMSYPDAIRDCDKAIELDHGFFKAYTRKATALLVMRDYRKCMDVLEEARAIDTEFKHTREIDELYNKAVQARFAPLPGETMEQTTERLSQDPEVDEIRRDPIMNTILQQAQNDPAALQDHMKNPEVRRKIGLLAAAGIIRTR